MDNTQNNQSVQQNGQNQQSDQLLAVDMAKALGYTENDGAPDLNNLSSGKSGEMKSIFQYTPATWKNYAEQVTGNSNLSPTPDNEVLVTTHQIYDWLQQGKSPQQIFSMWNAGQGEPDAYTGKFADGSPATGKNAEGVSYDVPAYVNKAMGYLKQFQSENLGQSSGNTIPEKDDIPASLSPLLSQPAQPQQPQQPTQPIQPAQQPAQNPPAPSSGTQALGNDWSNLVGLVQQALSNKST